MALTLWGLLEKSGVDPETIEQAVLRLITVHNEDETAHLETGQSLQSHKASEIIDHVANSIIEDKIASGEISSRCITAAQIIGKDFRTATNVGSGVDGVKMITTGIEMWQDGEKKVDIPVSGNPVFTGILRVQELQFLRHFWQTYFTSIDSFTSFGDGAVTIGLGGFLMTSGAVNGNRHSLSGDDSGTDSWNSNDGDVAFETTVRVVNATNAEAVFGINMNAGVPDNGSENESGIAFEIIGGKLYAVKYRNDATRDATEILASAPAGFHIYRAYYEVGVGIRYYYDGVLMHTYTTNLPTITTYVPFGYSIKTTTAANRYLEAFNLTMEGPLSAT